MMHLLTLPPSFSESDDLSSLFTSIVFHLGSINDGQFQWMLIILKLLDEHWWNDKQSNWSPSRTLPIHANCIGIEECDLMNDIYQKSCSSHHHPFALFLIDKGPNGWACRKRQPYFWIVIPHADVTAFARQFFSLNEGIMKPHFGQRGHANVRTPFLAPHKSRGRGWKRCTILEGDSSMTNADQWSKSWLLWIGFCHSRGSWRH